LTIHEPGQLRLCVPLEPSDYNQVRECLARREARAGKGKEPQPLDVTLRGHGLDDSTWKGKLTRMEEAEARFIPMMLSSRAGGPVPVKAPSGKVQGLVPQAQQYLVYIDIDSPDDSIPVHGMAQVKIYLDSESCFWWGWRKVNNMLNLRLMYRPRQRPEIKGQNRAR